MERVRYPNPLPELPYAPKLVHIPAPQANYASPVYAQRIAESQQLPVAVDAEAGMPLDLARMESLWLADARGAVTTSYPLDEAQLHDDDAFLLSDDVAARAPGVIEGAAPAPAQPADVTWLRRTEYLGAEQRKQRQAERSTRAQPLDTSRDAQIARIQEGFAAANAPLAELRHPSKPDVHAVDAYELLPDPETWATPMHVVRFTTALGRADVEDDVRMDTAVLRPYSDATGQRVSLYLASGETLPPYDDGTGDAPDPQAAADADAQVPDVCRLYALYKDSGKFINLADWYDAFVHALEADARARHRVLEADTAHTQVRFALAINELAYLGLLGPTGRKVEHLCRTVWDLPIDGVPESG